jgi:hypothetical protein
VSAAELRRAHVDRKTVARLVARGDWTQLWRGMDATDGQPPGPLALAHAAVTHAAAPGTGVPMPVVTGLAGARALRMRRVPSGSRVQGLVGAGVQRRPNEHVLVRRAHDLADVAVGRPGRGSASAARGGRRP